MPVSSLARSPKLRPAPKPLPAHRLELEPLESRWLPSAIRDLPGFHANVFPVGGSGTTQVFAGGRTDDGSSNAVNVGFTLNFFGVTTSTVFVNCNGNITFNQPFSTFTPTALNSNNGGIPIIAPYFADVDTRPAGSGVTMFGNDTLCGRNAFGVDWFNVGYFANHIDKLDTFQLILVDRSDTGVGNFDIEFNYEQIRWETGDASGGTNGFGGSSSAVGYSNGTGNAGTFFELTGSHVPGSFLDGGPDALINTSIMSDTPGRIHFLVRNGVVMNAMLNTTNVDLSNNIQTFFPFRWLTDPTTGVERGNLTLRNIGGVLQVTDPTDVCLGILSTQQETGISGPVSILFPNMPPGVMLSNPTGFTASGIPFITVNFGTLPLENPVLRVAIQIDNPILSAPTSFFGGFFPIRVIGGQFDPTML
jgi:hypothetical protein